MSTLSACPQCRTAIPAGQDRCLHCGHAVGAADTEAPVPAPRSETPPEMAPVADTTGIFVDPAPPTGRWRVWVAVAAAVVLTLTTLYAIRWAVFRPEATIGAYFDALADRDTGDALDAVGADLPDDRRRLLEAIMRSDAYEPPRDVKVLELERDEDEARAAIEFTLGGSTTGTLLTLRREPESVAGVFHRWRIGDGLHSVEFGAVPDELVVNGQTVPTRDGERGLELSLFPGVYQIGYPDHPLWSSAPVAVGVTEDVVGFEPRREIKPEAREEIDRQVRAYLDECARSADVTPDGCPFSVYISGFGETTGVKWTIERPPTYTLEEGRGGLGGSTGDLVLVTTERGVARVTGTYVSSTGSSPFDETAEFTLSGTVRVGEGGMVFEPRGF